MIAKDWDMLTEEDFAQIQNSSYQIESFRRPEGTETVSYTHLVRKQEIGENLVAQEIAKQWFVRLQVLRKAFPLFQ